MLVNNETYISFIRSKVGLNAVLLKFLGRQRRPYIVFRNRFLYGFMFVYIIIIMCVYIYLSRWRRRGAIIRFVLTCAAIQSS